MHPTNEELRSLAGIQKNNKNNKKNRYGKDNEQQVLDTFHVPRDLDIQVSLKKYLFLQTYLSVRLQLKNFF